MSIAIDRAKLTVEDFVTRFASDLIPISNTFSYFSTVPLAEEDLRHYLQDPIAAIPPLISALLPPVGIVLVPYLEKGNSRGADFVNFEKPAEGRWVATSRVSGGHKETLVFAIKDEDIADYHYTFYYAVGELVVERWTPDAQERFARVLREELGAEVHGEVDERSWHLKQALVRRQANVRKETKLFRDYARQSFIDTLTLYLHGTCCDIDVETGPRQMASRYLRRRLELLYSLYPPPDGYAVFPEQLKKR
ncbi:MAG TPA: hypothetical protein VFA33_00230 [Bryobacteraceae bacterium]|nr:hypothetical protein [Bryobacteraceae bacterium]